MDMPGVESMNMVEEHGQPMNHRLGEEGMNTVKEHDHPMNHQMGENDMNMAGIHMVEVEGMDMVEERPLNHRSEVEGIDREDSDMVEVEVVEREHEGAVLARHWISDGAERHWRAHQEWEELAKSGCSEGHTTFVSQDFNCLTWCRVLKRVDEMCVK
jgi:hypothetical protein